MNYSRYGNPLVGFQRILLPSYFEFRCFRAHDRGDQPRCRLLSSRRRRRSFVRSFVLLLESKRGQQKGEERGGRGLDRAVEARLLRRAGWPRRVAKRGSATTVEGWWKEAFLSLSLSLPPLRISRFIHPSWRWSCGGIEERNCSASR